MLNYCTVLDFSKDTYHTTKYLVEKQMTEFQATGKAQVMAVVREIWYSTRDSSHAGKFQQKSLEFQKQFPSKNRFKITHMF